MTCIHCARQCSPGKVVCDDCITAGEEYNRRLIQAESAHIRETRKAAVLGLPAHREETRMRKFAIEVSIRRVKWMIRKLYGEDAPLWVRQWLQWSESRDSGLAALNMARNLEAAAECRLVGVTLSKLGKHARTAAAATIRLATTKGEYGRGDWVAAAERIRRHVNTTA